MIEVLQQRELIGKTEHITAFYEVDYTEQGDLFVYKNRELATREEIDQLIIKLYSLQTKHYSRFSQDNQEDIGSILSAYVHILEAEEDSYDLVPISCFQPAKQEIVKKLQEIIK